MSIEDKEMKEDDVERAEEKSKEDEVKDVKGFINLWMERITISKQASDDWFKKSGVERVIEEYNGKFNLFQNGLKGRIPVPPINTIWAYVQTDIASTYNRDPFISVNPRNEGSVLGAKLWEAILNYYWGKLKLKEELEPEIIDKDLCGFAWHKVGWAVETDGASEELKIESEGLYSARVEPKDIVWNLGAKCPPKDCLWMAQRIVKPLKYVKEKYPAAAKLKGQPCHEIDKNAYEKASFKDDISVAVLWEVWDGQKREKFLLAEGMTDKYLQEPVPWPEYMEAYPFIYYFDFHAPGEPRPTSAILPWEGQVLEEMVLMSAAVNHHKRWNRQAVIKQGFIDTVELDKLERGDDCGYVMAHGSGSVAENVMSLDWGAMPVDYYMLIDRLKSIRNDVSGQSEFMRGGVTKGSTRTEGELQLMMEGAKGRVDRRIDRFETHVENIANHMLAHLKANFDFEESVYITGKPPEEILAVLGNRFDPVTQKVTFDPEEIAGEYEVEVKAGSTIPLNKENKISLLQTILQTLAQVDRGQAGPFMRTVIKELLDEYDMKSLVLAEKEELEAQAQMQEQAAQEGDANEIKARTQGAKNAMQAQKISADTDKIEMENMAVQQVMNTPGSMDNAVMAKLFGGGQ